MKKINIGKNFHYRLANRDERQGDGKHTAVEFRKKYLKELEEKPHLWKNGEPYIDFDFSEVKVIGPSFANEAFAYFTKNHSPEEIMGKIKFSNISRVKELIIKEELESGYRK